jgi:hypothetical protein
VKFVHANHFVDLDGNRLTIGLTKGGEVWINESIRLSPDLADRVSAKLTENARSARGIHAVGGYDPAWEEGD